MTMPTVAQLTRVVTAEEALDETLRLLQSMKIDVSSWDDFSTARAIAYAAAYSDSERSKITAAIAGSHFNGISAGDWLTLMSDSHYDNQRYEASRALWDVTLSPGPNAPTPITINVSDLVIVLPNGATLRNTTGGTLTAATNLPLEWQAEVAGTDGNNGSGVTGLLLQTPITDVTLIDAAVTTSGANEERDSSLWARNRTKWASLSANGPTAAYEYWARSASSAVTRVQVDNRDVGTNGEFNIYVAGDDGPIGAPATITAISDYINGWDGSLSRPIQPRRAALGALPTIVDASVIGTLGINTTCTVYMLRQYYVAGTTETLIENAIDELMRTVPIGGTKLDPSAPFDGTFILLDLYGAIKAITGIQNVAFSTITGDIAMTPGQVATRSPASVVTVRLI